MRRAMAEAPVGDDQYGDDPSVNLLQERIAALLGKEAALFVPSGTMANQIGLKLLTRPGDDVILGHETHMVWHESGAGAANAGVQFTAIGTEGLFTAAEFRSSVKPAGHMMFPPTSLVAIENTHNRCGGLVFPQSDAAAICDAARAARHSHLFGRRAPVQCGGGIGADGGRTFRAVRNRVGRVVQGIGLSGGKRRRRIESRHRACGSHPAHVRRRHAAGGHSGRGRALCARAQYRGCPKITRMRGESRSGWRKVRGVRLDLATVQSNIVIFHMEEGAPDAAAIAARAKDSGVLVSVFGARKLRAVTHLDVSRDDCVRAADILARVIGNG